MAAVKKNVQTIAEKDGTPFESVSQALSALTTEERSLSIIYLVQNGDTVDRYFFKDGVEDADFVIWETEGGGASFDCYKARMSQSGSSAPTATIINEDDDNFLGTITWSRVTTGQYRGTLTGAFTSNKVLCFPSLVPRVVDNELWAYCYREGNNSLYLEILTQDNVSGLALYTDGFSNLVLNVEVYP